MLSFNMSRVGLNDLFMHSSFTATFVHLPFNDSKLSHPRKNNQRTICPPTRQTHILNAPLFEHKFARVYLGSRLGQLRQPFKYMDLIQTSIV